MTDDPQTTVAVSAFLASRGQLRTARDQLDRKVQLEEAEVRTHAASLRTARTELRRVERLLAAADRIENPRKRGPKP